MATTPTKRPRKVVPAKEAVKRDADGNVVIPTAMRRTFTEILTLTEQIAELEAQLKEKKSEALIFVEATGESSISYDNAKFTKVQSTKAVMDEDELKNRVGTAIFTTISKRVVDKKLLEASIQKGKVTAKDVADVTTISQNKPYLKVTKA